MIFSVFIFLGCTDSNLAVYRNKEVNIKIKYPKTWRLIENTDGAAVIFVSPKETSLDYYQENLNVVVQELPRVGAMPLKLYSIEAVNQITRTIPNIEVVSNHDTILSQNLAHRFEYIIKSNFNLRVIHLWAINNRKAYQVTFACDVDHCDKYMPLANAMFDSFEIPEIPQ